MNSISGKLEHFLVSLETRFGLLISSFFVSVLMLIVAMLYVQPSFELVFHGVGFSELSRHPFDFESANPLQNRILAPLLGYLLFLRGKLFFILPLIFEFLFISTVYFHFRKKNWNSLEAFVMTSLMAFSTTVLIPLIAPAYTDPVTFFFVFLSFANTRNANKSAAFFAFALLNHESSIVLLPGLFFYSMATNKISVSGITKYVLAFTLACVPFLFYRWYVSRHVSIPYSVNYYFSEENIGINTKYLFHFLPAAVFYAFKLFWFFPLYVIMKMTSEKKFGFPLLIIFIVACVTSQLIIAADYTRMMSLAFPVIIISAEKVREWWGTEKFIRLSLMLILFNFFILQYYVINEGLTALFPWFYNIIAALCGHPNV